MELKDYQKQVMDDLTSYMNHLKQDKDMFAAWRGYWMDKDIPVGLGSIPAYKSAIPGVPHVCTKVPTGGGKTFMACAALKRIFSTMPLDKPQVVVWLVPSDSILTQTIRNLSNPDHEYRLRLNSDFAGRVGVYTKEMLLGGQQFSPDTVREMLTVCVLSYASLRIDSKKKDVRKVYQENGSLLEFARYFQDDSVLLADTPDTALIQVLRQLSPVVVVDESHNAGSDLSVEMLNNLNPSFVLDLTATPRKNSNILSYVDARELKKENMVKLPVVVYNRTSRQSVIQDAIQLRGSIAQQAIAEEQAGGAYIRPIVLFQAQPKVNEDSETFDKIKTMLPDTKPSYYVIDRVEISGNKDFSPEPLYFSDKLTCIIGGKSTGKSLLLHNMAMAIDEEQVRKKEETAATNVKRIPELKVYWHDGVCSSDREKQRKIVYIPQTYLNRLSDEEQETTEIDTIIQEIVLQDEKCREAYNVMAKRIAEKKQEVTKSIVDFLRIVSDRKLLCEQCKAIGDEKSINSEIQELNTQLEQLSKEYNVTEEEIKKYQKSMENIQLLKGKVAAVSKEIALIKEISAIVEVKPLAMKEITIYSGALSDAAEKVKRIADEAWTIEREGILKEAYDYQNQVESSIKEQEEIVAALQPKMEGNERISKLSDALVSEREKISQLAENQTKLKTIQKQYEQYLGMLSHVFLEFSTIYLGYIDSVNDGFVPSAGDLEFSVKKVLRVEQFSRKIGEMLDNRSLGRFTKFNLRNITEGDLQPENIAAFIESLLSNSFESLQLKTSYGIESALREILTDWYNVDYIVKMDNDNIQDMSPGKKALVLLRLLISLAESSCPILIDQPEDDLDNRSIFDELIRFVKEKKVDRQIITVTHNANIVLGGDAELVIVANQNGKNAPNKQFRFEYRGGAIEDISPVITEGVLDAGILNGKGIQEHICEILEGEEQAFALRQHKYNFIKR